jgi:hypothetical protein
VEAAKGHGRLVQPYGLRPGRRERQGGGIRNHELFKLLEAERWEIIIRHLQRHFRDDVAVASREALKAEAAARLARLRYKKQNHNRLCATPRDKCNGFIKAKPCRREAGL